LCIYVRSSSKRPAEAVQAEPPKKAKRRKKRFFYSEKITADFCCSQKEWLSKPLISSGKVVATRRMVKEKEKERKASSYLLTCFFP
jgi:hypothetical protein